MKTSFKLTALLVVASLGVFAATPSKAAIVPVKDVITFSTLPSEQGVDIKIDKTAPGKTVVQIYDQAGNVLRKDVLSAGKTVEKAYILNQLEDGDYIIAVTSNHQTVKKNIHVYEEVRTKQFIVVE